jgi:catechol 1,2-dioxygenase
MPAKLIDKKHITELAAKAAGLDMKGGNPRLKTIMNRLLSDLFQAIDDLDISMDEFWAGVGYIGASGQANELGLLVPGVALEHFLDLRLDEVERLAGLNGRIRGPLFFARCTSPVPPNLARQ